MATIPKSPTRDGNTEVWSPLDRSLPAWKRIAAGCVLVGLFPVFLFLAPVLIGAALLAVVTLPGEWRDGVWYRRRTDERPATSDTTDA